MKPILPNRPAFKKGVMPIVVMLLLFAAGCSKTNKDNSSFSGTYIGTLSVGLYSAADTVIVTTGSSSSSIVMTSHTGQGSVYAINATTSGHSLDIPSQSLYVSTYSNNYTVTGSGNLSGSSLKTLNLSYTFVSPTNSTTYLSFQGDKQ